ncbi:MAG: SDR family NAD(P)-dependent oxidoreductase, partial [Candidatus Heimdallarchaeota archaeon]|nr:SDR family NAD(P)-dependent oxidoreductase [Candidatus Heimdallarchaeota archaeon]
MESEKLTGKVAIITGAGRGMGKSIAIGLAKQGAEVSIASRTEKELQDLESEITKFGGKTKYFVTDVGLEEQAIALVQNTVSHFGRLDILINNAGVGAGGPWEHTKTEDYDRVMAINVRGPFILCRE